MNEDAVEPVNASYLEAVTLPAEASALQAGATNRVVVDLAGTIVEVCFTQVEAADFYRGRYRHMLSTATPERSAYAVVTEASVGYFWIHGATVYRWDRTEATPYTVAFLTDAVVNTGVFTSSPGSIAFHAGTVGDGRGVAALFGSSTAGKTTTSLACTRRGLTLYSDEYCIVTERGVVPFLRSLSIRCAATEVLANDPVPSSVDAWLASHGCCDGYDLGYDELFGEIPRLAPSPLRVAFALTARAAAVSLRPIGAHAMIEHARPWAKMEAQGLERLERLFALFESVRCYELTIGTPDATARAIVSVLAEATRTEAA